MDLVVTSMVHFKTTGGRKTRKAISYLTAVYSAIYWLNIFYVNNNSSTNIRRKFEDNWICHYPRLSIEVNDNVT